MYKYRQMPRGGDGGGGDDGGDGGDGGDDDDDDDDCVMMCSATVRHEVSVSAESSTDLRN